MAKCYLDGKMLGKHIGKGQCSEPFQLKLMQKKIFDMFTLKENSSDLQINFLAKSSWTWTKSLDWSTSISIQVFSIICFLREKKHPDPHPLWTMLEQRWFHVSTPTARHAPSHSMLLALSPLQKSPRRLAEIGHLKTERLTLKTHKYPQTNIYESHSNIYQRLWIQTNVYKRWWISLTQLVCPQVNHPHPAPGAAGARSPWRKTSATWPWMWFWYRHGNLREATCPPRNKILLMDH